MEQLFSNVLSKFREIKAQTSDPENILLKTAELLKSEIPHYDWVGFYLLDPKDSMLILGPYKGAPTDHTHIPVGKGICGQVAESGQTMTIQDVSQQDNYLACSLDVQSEIVVPILKNGLFVAEIDIDSHAYAPFSIGDEKLLEAIAEELSEIF